jgi:autotransporter-associated beta strand protein
MSNFKSLTRIAAISLAFVAGLLAMAPGAALAQSGTWNSSSTTPAAWTTTARWSEGIVAGGTDSTATFTNGSTVTPLLLSNIVLGNLSTGASRVTIRSGTQANYVDLTNEEIQFATTTGTAPAIANTGRLDMFAIIAGSQGLTKSGAGALYLNRSNTYTGVTTITAGDVRLAQNNGLGDNSAGNGTVIQSGAMLRLDNASTSSGVSGIQTAEAFTISGDGLTSLGALRSQAGTGNAFTGPITLAANASIKATVPLTLSGSINPNSYALLLGDAGGFNVSGGFVGTGSVSIGSDGAITLSGSSSFTGGTSVSGQTGLVTMTGYMAGPMDFSPGSNGRTLIGTGTFAGGLAVGQFATVAPGAIQASDYGTITSSTFSLQSAQLLMGIQNASTFDKLVMTAGSNGLTLGGSANLALDFAGLLPNFSSLKLLDFNGITGSFSGLSSTGSYTGTWVDTSGVWKLAGVGTGGQQDLTFTQSTGVLAVVPEPSTVVLLGGSAAATVLFRLVRRRRAG